MPPVRKDTTPAEVARDVATRVASEGMTTAAPAGNALPAQQAAHAEHEWP